MRRLLLVLIVGCGDGHRLGGDAGGDAGDANLTVTGDAGIVADLDFSTVDVGQFGTAMLKVSNDGTATTGPLAVAISGDAANDFAIDNAMTSCAGARLDAGGTCSIALRFSPTAEGTREATLAISADPGGNATVALHGMGHRPMIALDPTSTDFGIVQAGTSVSSTIHVTNNGTTPATLASIVGTGDVSRGITTCGTVLDVGETCDVAVTLAVADLADHSGQLVVTSAGVAHVATLTAQGATSLTVNRTGSGTGTVTSSPAGIDCGPSCSAMFRSDVVLTATPAAGSAFTGWSAGSCGTDPTCTIPLGVSPSTVTASFALTGNSSIDITFAGSAIGEVRVDVTGTPTTSTTCFSSCSVPAQAGDMVTIAVATPSDFTGWSGACSGGFCQIVSLPAGSTAVTATFDHDPKQVWTRLPFAGEPVNAAAFDSAGNLVAVTSAHLIKLDPAGSTLWTRNVGGNEVATGVDRVYVVTASNLIALDGAGTMLWSIALDANSSGCMGGFGISPGFLRCVGVGPDGGIVVHGVNGVAKYNPTGTSTWSAPISQSSNLSVAIESSGVVDVGVRAEITGDELDTLRLSASDGSLLARYDRTALGTAGMFAIDASDYIIGSSTGTNDQACLRQTLAADTFGFTKCIDLKTAGRLANGLAIAGTGDIAWLHYDLEASPPTKFTLHRMTSTGTETWVLNRDATTDIELGPRGTIAFDIVADPSGRFAIIGEYRGLTYDGAWIQVFSP